MSNIGFELRIKITDIIESQLPEFVRSENPKVSEFLKQYYIGQEYQSGPIDIIDNLDQYLKLDNLTPEVIEGSTYLSSDITSTSTTINVISTKGFPKEYGLLKIDDEIITYTGLTETSFTGCIRGFSGVTDYHKNLNATELVFSETESQEHLNSSEVKNLSVLFLQEFYKKIKYSLTPGLENVNFTPNLDVGNFIKESRTLYASKGTDESFRILFNVLFEDEPKIINLEDFLIKPSSATYSRRKIAIAESISGNILNLKGQVIIKTTDSTTTASISEIEPISRNNKQYYKLSIFVGYDDSLPTVTGNVDITGNTRNIDYVNVGSSVIIVDSTIGFPESGKLYSGNNVITYTNKSINQFFGCSGVSSGISTASTIYSQDTYYGYENGDITKKVELRLVGVISDFNVERQVSSSSEGEYISVKSIGELIKNSNSTRKEIFANSWIYNTNPRYKIDKINSPNRVVLKTPTDSDLRVDDTIDILLTDSEEIIYSNLKVDQIINGIVEQEIQVNQSLSLNQNIDYDIRRKTKFADINNNNLSLEYSNLFSDIQNVYNDSDEYFYAASNSLPSYEINSSIFSYNASQLTNEEFVAGEFTNIKFPQEVSFITGDLVYYKPLGNPIEGLTEGTYYVEVLTDKTEIRLYISNILLGTTNYIKFYNFPTGDHNFTLLSQKSKVLSAQRLLRKFPLLPKENNNNSSNVTEIGGIGLLSNGVEILNYKSENKIYYGPLEKVNVLNGGDDYDVINPPLLEVDSGIALVQPVVRGSIVKIYTDPQDFDVDVVVSVSVSGGNGEGASFQPVVEKRKRQLRFDARLLSVGGGINVDDETITFEIDHGLSDGETIIYDSNNNQNLGIGVYKGSNNNSGLTLKNGVAYVAKYINDDTIQIYPSISDFKSGINTIGITTIGNSGIHNFYTLSKNTLTSIKTINGGSNFENRKLRVLPVGISTINDTIFYENHGFNEGELVSYEYQTTSISGLTTTNQYYVKKIDNNYFKLSDAGIGGTFRNNYEREKYVNFNTTGSGYQIFKYPDIVVNVNYSSVGIGSTQVTGTIVSTPVVRGSIIDTYVYEKGSNYGSEILNYHQKPKITVLNGTESQLSPVILGGKIVDVQVSGLGRDYYSTPELKVVGDGVGAILRPIVTNNGISGVIIIDSGYGYTQEKTQIIVESAGRGAIFDPQIRSLTLNNNFLYGSEILKESYRNLQYSICSYSKKIQDLFGDSNEVEHSPIIGWAYDGNPIYGTYGYEDPEKIQQNTPIKRLKSGYVTKNVVNRPSTLPIGFFIEDYEFNNSGDLDEYNGRFCVTPEFPNGTYAYFATKKQNNNGDIIPAFPYFIGNTYKSDFISENKVLNQSFDFNNSKLIRNTFPYKVFGEYTKNDFVVGSDGIANQFSVVDSVESGEILDFNILNPGRDYKVNDAVIFEDDKNQTNIGLDVRVSEILGQKIESIEVESIKYNNAIFTWKVNDEVEVNVIPSHNYKESDYVEVSGFSYENEDDEDDDEDDDDNLNKSYRIGVTTSQTCLIQNIPSGSSGIVTDIYVSNIPKNISINSNIKIENEELKVLNCFYDEKVVRVIRSSGVAHTSTNQVEFIPSQFTIKNRKKKKKYSKSKVNDELYFNPTQSVGIGTTSGIGILSSYKIGNLTKDVFIPTQSIYLPKHKFKTGQKVNICKKSSSSSISVANTSSGASFDILSGVSTEQTVYAIKHNDDYIGICTQIGLTTTTNGLFFLSNGSDDYQYSIKSDYEQVFGNVEVNNVLVTLSTSHNMSSGDIITLSVIPNESTGIGTSSSVNVQYDPTYEKLIVNPINFSSSSISTVTSQITISNHNLITGDKVIYTASSLPSGLENRIYYIYKVDNDRIKFCETIVDSKNIPPTTVEITSAPVSTHQIKIINPSIDVIKGNNLVFNLSDSSLSGYEFKIFSDNFFENEFVSSGIDTSFVVTGSGTSLTVKYSDSIKNSLYYCLEKSGSIINPDEEVVNYSKINFVDSKYSGTYSVVSTSSTTFRINLKNSPERNSYNSINTKILKYTTTSKTAKGEITKVNTISSKSNFKKLPIFNSVTSADGNNAYIVPTSNKIGKIKKINFLSSVYEYSSDKTLRPEALISNLLYIKDAYTISEILIIEGGKNYITPPDLILVNTETGNIINSGIINASLTSSSISEVNIEQPPKGISEDIVEIRAINNTNGVRIQDTSYLSGTVSCTLITPLSGFSQEPFTLGDKIFVEGIQFSNGDGFNSENYGYAFFTVEEYLNGGTSTPRVLKFSIDSVIPGTPVNFTGQIINYNNYPKFSLTKVVSNFILGENLEVSSGINFNKEDLRIVESNKGYVKVSGSYVLKPNDLIRGVQSASIATISGIQNSSGYFNIGYSYDQSPEWKDDIGKLSQDSQVIPDNDYYQNLSYSIKSKQTWEDIVSPVNSILHPAGLKNFSDTQIISTTRVGILTSKTKDEYTSIVNKFINENRVDAINNFDLVVDIDTFNNTSEFLQFKNKKLSNFIELRTNRVLTIDDISDEFNIFDESDGFDVSYQGTPIFMKTFNPSDSQVLNLTTGEFNITNHFFNTGEELIYRPNQISGSLGIGTTSNNVGVSTNILPSTVYAIRIDNDTFKISTRKEYSLAEPPIAVSFTNTGIGNSHEFEMVKCLEKSIISINDVVQSPIAYSLLSYTLNTPSGIGSTAEIFSLSGISSISPNDILKIDSEYMKVVNVGFGTSTFGPVSFSGTFPLVEVNRGFVGSISTSHSNSTNIYLYRGSFNIVKNKIYFTDSLISTLDNNSFFTSAGIETYVSDFNGRVFLRKDYTTNQVYDNISEKFTGIGQTYPITVGGANTIGVGSTGGNGLIFINGIFQTPSTQNNNIEANTNYSIVENTIAGITSVVFTGVRLENGSLFINDSDVNMNELPRGGLIVSLGSTPGLGYAPLVGASVTAIIGAGGSITSIGIGTSGNWGSGYRGTVSVAVTQSGHSGSISTITATVGVGGSLSFTIVNGGSGYTNPIISVPSPSYSNLSVIGVSRLGVGATTDCGKGLLLDLEVKPSTSVGIGTTLFEISNFKIVRNGYGFKRGDVVKVVGLVTDSRLASPVSEFKLEILETFNDSFSGWQFGELDYIDSIKNYQNGVRVRFPLFYNGELLSFQRSTDADSQLIDIDSLLIIFINGILQKPGEAYQFTGGTTFRFSSPPRSEDDISIFFYRGSSNDSSIFDVQETIKDGDSIQVFSNNNYLGITTTQRIRNINEISSSDTIRTNLYLLDGIDEANYKPVTWYKQKADKIIDGNLVYKSRNSIESQIYPTAKVIKNFTSNDTVIFTDNAEFFNYERDQLGELDVEFDAIIFSGNLNSVPGAVTATVGNDGTIQGLTIDIVGSGYTGSNVSVSISSPPVGSGVTATATISIVNGSLSTPNIINPGSEYDASNPPQVLIPSPSINYEVIKSIPSSSGVNGSSGSILGIQSSSGIGTSLAIRFTLDSPGNLSVGDIIFVFDTKVGSGVTSIVNSNSDVIGVGTQFLDNIYHVSAFNSGTGIATCNVRSNSNLVGIATAGSFVGKYSWGKLSGFVRSNSPVSIAVSGYTVDVGLTTFPTIQRRGLGGLRKTGSLGI